jgi:hypothetical protein
MHASDLDDRRPPPPSRNARYLFGFLLRHTGSMRIAPLLRASALAPDDLAAAIDELSERCWLEVTWRGPGALSRPGLPDRFRTVDRVATTRFGRWRYARTWVIDAA